jgi:DNA-binding CsgD family transcriptional regulator
MQLDPQAGSPRADRAGGPDGQERPAGALLVSDRPAVAIVFDCLSQRGTRAAPPGAPLRPLVLLAQLPPGLPLTVLARHGAAVARASVALVDVHPDPEAAASACRTLRARRPDLPIAALFCCDRMATPQALRALREAGATSFLDSVATGEQFRADLRRVLGLVAAGQSDRQIGAALHLSPDTVQKCVRALRRLAGGMPNRKALAAWAGRCGLAESAGPPEWSAEAAGH